MGKETYALFTGLFVLILGSALIGISIWLGHYGEERDVYLVTTRASVSGLIAESMVFYRGVQAGKVSAISFDPKDPRIIQARIEVNQGLPITRGTFAKLRIQGLTGLAQIELGDEGENTEPLPTSSENPALIPLRPSLLDKLSDSGGNILLQAEQLLVHLDELLNDGNRERVAAILANLETASSKLAGLEERMDSAYATVKDAAIKVKGAGVELKDASLKAQQTFAHIDPVVVELGKLSGRIQALAESANALAVSGKHATDATTKTTLPRLDEALEELRSATAQIRKLSGLLEKDPQALIYGHLPPESGPGEPGYQEPR
ncbi:MAG: MlaD family protein [Methylococcaceae bacterium]|nr:MlaD family protein [Methylococcaceae bacterium]